jgi:uncharacterized membrane protein SirB2
LRVLAALSKMPPTAHIERCGTTPRGLMYLLLKYLHVCVAVLTLSGFILRGYWMLCGSMLLQRRWVKIAPHIIDTIFLLSGIALITLLKLPVLHSPWLLAKFAALLLYIVLGAIALRRGRTRRVRATAFMLALAMFAYIVGVALSKSTASWFALA